jgi:hypothetical protein
MPRLIPIIAKSNVEQGRYPAGAQHDGNQGLISLSFSMISGKFDTCQYYFSSLVDVPFFYKSYRI